MSACAWALSLSSQDQRASAHLSHTFGDLCCPQWTRSSHGHSCIVSQPPLCCLPATNSTLQTPVASWEARAPATSLHVRSGLGAMQRCSRAIVLAHHCTDTLLHLVCRSDSAFCLQYLLQQSARFMMFLLEALTLWLSESHVAVKGTS